MLTPKRVGVALLVVLTVAAVSWYVAAARVVPGLGTAADEPDFAECARAAGVDLAGADELDQRAEEQRWRQPGLLRCAESTLDDDELAEALQRVLLDEERRTHWLLGTGRLEPADVDTQEVMVRSLAREVATSDGAEDDDAAVTAAGRVLRSVDDPDRRRLLAELAAFEVLRADGRVAAYDRFLADEDLPDVRAAVDEFRRVGPLGATDRERWDQVTEAIREDAGE